MWLSASTRSTGLVCCLCSVMAIFSDTQVSAATAKFFPASDPVVLSGTNLTINCTIQDGAPFDASTLYFQLKDLVIDKRHVQVLDSWTAQLQVPVYRNQSSNHLYCLSHKFNETLDQKLLTVGDKPVKPNITSCQVYDWKNMTCWWLPKEQDTGLRNTTTTLYWAVSSGPANKICGGSSLHGHCQFNLSMPAYTHYIWVNAENLLGSVPDQFNHATATWVDSPAKHVKPAAVQHFKGIERGERWLYLSWDSPAPGSHRLVHFELNYTDQWNLNPRQVTINSTSDDLTVATNLTDLIPNAWYTMALRSKPLVDGKIVGYFSDFFKNTSITKPDVPDRAPVTTPELFQILSGIDSENTTVEREVRILWKAPPNHTFNGELKNYIVRYCEHGAESWMMDKAPPDVTYHDLKLKDDVQYDIQVDIANQLGYNPRLQLSNITVPNDAQLLALPSELVGFGNHTHVSLQWTRVEGATGYTVYWCHKNLYRHTCQDELKWMDVSGSDASQWERMMPASYNLYLLAVSARGQAAGISSGLLWTDCIHDVSADLNPPTDVKLGNHQPVGGLTLQWRPPTCQSSTYVRAYLILYCQANTQCDQPDEWESVEVKGHEQTYTLQPLTARQTYRMKMRSVGLQTQLSAFSNEITAEVYGSGLRTGQLVGVIIGCLLVLLLVLAGLFTIIRICKKKVERYGHVEIDTPARIKIENTEYTQEDYEPENGRVSVVDDRVTYYPESYGQTATQENEANYASYKLQNMGNGVGKGVSNPSSFHDFTANSQHDPQESMRLLNEDPVQDVSANSTGGRSSAHKSAPPSEGYFTQGDSVMTGASGSISPYSTIDQLEPGPADQEAPHTSTSPKDQQPKTSGHMAGPGSQPNQRPVPTTPTHSAALDGYVTLPDSVAPGTTSPAAIGSPQAADCQQEDYSMVGLADPTPHSPVLENNTAPTNSYVAELPCREGQYVDSGGVSVPGHSPVRPPAPYVDNQTVGYVPNNMNNKPVHQSAAAMGYVPHTPPS